MRYDLDITPWDHLYSNPLSGRNTLTYCSTLVPIWPESMIYGSQVAPSIREEVLIRINRLLADPNTPRDVYFVFFVWHPWCDEIWDQVIDHRIRDSHLGSDSAEDVRQGMKLLLLELISDHSDLRGWLEGAVSRGFHGWTYTLIDNLCQEMVNAMRRGTFGSAKMRRGTPEYDDWAEVADESASNTSIVEWMLDRDEKLAGLPKRTQQVVWLKNIGYTWDEIAETLAITRDAARWAFDSCPAEVKRVLGCDV